MKASAKILLVVILILLISGSILIGAGIALGGSLIDYPGWGMWSSFDVDIDAITSDLYPPEADIFIPKQILEGSEFSAVDLKIDAAQIEIKNGNTFSINTNGIGSNLIYTLEDGRLSLSATTAALNFLDEASADSLGVNNAEPWPAKNLRPQKRGNFLQRLGLTFSVLDNWDDNFWDRDFENIKRRSLIITIPPGTNLEQVSIYARGTDLTVNDIACIDFTLTAVASKVDVTGITATERPYLNTSFCEVKINDCNFKGIAVTNLMGSFILGGIITGNNAFTNKSGYMRLNINGNADDYNINAANSLGSLVLNNKEYSGSNKKNIINPGATNNISLANSLGELNLNFTNK